LATVPLFANLAELVERGIEGFSAIALAKADEDPDSGIYEQLVSGIVLISHLQDFSAEPKT